MSAQAGKKSPRLVQGAQVERTKSTGSPWISQTGTWRFAMFGLVAAGGLAVQLGSLGLLHKHFDIRYAIASAGSVLVAMSFNFLVHNVFTFADRRLRGRAQLKGWFSFCLASAVGGVFNMAVATGFYVQGWHWAGSGFLGAVAGGLVNYALASRYTWKPGEH